MKFNKKINEEKFYPKKKFQKKNSSIIPCNWQKKLLKKY